MRPTSRIHVKVKSRFHHDCELSRDQTQTFTSSPYDNWWQKNLRTLRQYFTIDLSIFKHHHFKSTAAFKAERKRHVTKQEYHRVIHPYSKFTQIKDAIASCIMFMTYFMESFFGTFLMQQKSLLEYRQHNAMEIVALFLECVLFIDMALRFLDGYIVDKTREIILDLQMIKRRYLRTFFLLDFLPVIGALSTPLICGIMAANEVDDVSIRKVAFCLYQLHRLRIARLAMILENFDKFLRTLNISESFRKIWKCFLLGIVLMHTLCCLTFEIRIVQLFLGTSSKDTILQIFYNTHRTKFEGHRKRISEVSYSYAFYLYAIYLCAIVSHFFGTGNTLYRTADPMEMAFMALVLMIGLVFYVYCIAQVLQMFGVVKLSESAYDSFVVQVNQYLHEKEVGSQLKKRIFTYFDYKFNKKYFSEKKILNDLSQHLQLEIILYSCSSLINEVSIFKGLNNEAIGRILALLKQEIYLADDVIQNSMVMNGCLYFILHGTCTVKISATGKEVMHLEDGGHFGDLTGFTALEISDDYNVEAVELVEVYRLDKEDIEYCTDSQPELLRRLEHMAFTKAKKFNDVFITAQTDENRTEDILDELRRHKILHRGLKRTDFH